jgi:chromosome segregation ATPase
MTRGVMQRGEELDQFRVLEEKVDSLIQMVTDAKRDRESMLEKLHIQEEKIADLTSEVEALRGIRDKAKQRILSLLEKMEQLDLKA